MPVKFWGQCEIRVEYQAIFWYLFLVDDISGISDNYLEKFIRSNYFTEYCLPFVVKKYVGGSDRFLQRAFNEDALDLSYFKVFTKEGIIDYFNEYSKSGNWGNDGEAFLTLVDRFNEFFRKEASDHFF